MKHMFFTSTWNAFIPFFSLFLSLTFSISLTAQNFVSTVARYDHKDGLSDSQLEWVFQDSKGLIWIGASNGINKYDGQQFELVAKAQFNQRSIVNIFEDEAFNLWISSGEKDAPYTIFNTISYQLSKGTELAANKVTRKSKQTRAQDFEVNWEIGTDNVKARHEEMGQIFNLRVEYPTLPILNINHWITGKANTWIATDQGLFKIGLKQNYFQRLIYTPQKNLKLGNIPESNIYFYRGIYGGNISSDGKGNVYATTRRKGIIEINNNKTIVDSQSGNFWGSYFDGERYFWISRFDDILRYDIKTKTERIFEFPNGGDKAWSFYTDEDGKLWIGCNRDIYYVESNGNKLITFNHGFDEDKVLPMKQKYFFQKDSEGNIWMGATAGLFKINFEKGITDHYWPGGEGEHHLPVLELRHLHEDKNGIFWIATTKGLVRWDRKNQKYRKFDIRDGFSSERIFSVYGDDYGYLWLSSENGIMQFSKKTFEVKAFQKSDGITHNIFNRISHHQAKDGTIYFGGFNGVTSFHPRDFQSSFNKTQDAAVILTEANTLKGKEQFSLSRIEDFYFQNKIIISPNDKFLDMKFELLNYDPFAQANFEYKIDLNNESNNGEWNALAANHLQVASLPYGAHTLMVRGRTPYAQISHQPLSIPIQVKRPIYLKLWFYAMLMILGFGGYIYFQRRKTIKHIERQKELEQIVKKRTHKIQSQAVELQELDKAKSRFLENISHEFRTPLTLILNILNKEEIEDLDAVEISKGKIFGKTELEILQRNSGRLKLLIDQLLDLSKLEAGKMDIQKEIGEIHFYIKGIVQTFKSLAAQNNIDLVFTSNAQTTRLEYDRDKMDKIFYNLLSNAIKYSPSGGIIRVDLQSNGDDLIISIQDTGIGIPEAAINKIFERFYQVERKDKFNYEGSGLGLALVKEFVELHQGKIEVESKPGEGTIFTLHFPIGTNEMLETSPPESSSNIKLSNSITALQLKTAEIPSNTKPTDDQQPLILIIEDNADLRFYHHKVMSNKYRLLFAEDGPSGLEAARKNIPDLIICDVMMPGITGFEVCETLKKDELCNHIPLILLTAKATKSDRMTGVAGGADYYIIKPFNQKELNLRIQNILAQRKILQEKFTNKSIALNPINTPLQDPFIRRLTEIIDANIQDVSFGILELSEAVELSRSQLFRKIKAITGNTPTEFLNKHRLQKAHQLLVDGAGNASEISYRVGFRTPNYFHKCFKAEYGFTPGEVMRSTHG